MTSLTPQRDALARTALDRLPTNGTVDEIERRLCLDLMEAALLPVADMMDLGAPLDDIQLRLVNAIANVLVSHCLSLAGGEKNAANKVAIVTLDALIDRVRSGINKANPTISVSSDVERQAGGRA